MTPIDRARRTLVEIHEMDAERDAERETIDGAGLVLLHGLPGQSLGTFGHKEAFLCLAGDSHLFQLVSVIAPACRTNRVQARGS
jgi:hypothetical protein